ncbi:MAG: PAS domain S-box protein [Verrucomicrobiota bacterium]
MKTSNGWIGKLASAGRACAYLAVAFSALTVWSWIAGVADVCAFDPVAPVAPATSLALFLLSLGVLLQSRWPDRPGSLWFCRGTSFLVMTAGSLAALRFSFGWRSLPEIWLWRSVLRVDYLPPRFMAPMAGIGCALTAGALFLKVAPARWHQGGWRLSQLIAASVTAAALARTFGAALGWRVVSIDYAPLPISLVAATLIALLSTAVLGLARQEAPRLSEGSQPEPPALAWAPVAVTSLLATFIGLMTAIYLAHEEAADRRNARQLLSTVGKLKESQILNWREERLNDARFFAHADFVARDIDAFFSAPDSEAIRARVLHWLNLLKAGERYALVALYDANQTLRLVLPAERNDPLSPTVRPLLAEAFRTNQVLMSDLRRTGAEDDLYMDVVFRVSHPQPETAVAGRSAELAPLGLVLLRLDPRQFLFPLIASWPTPSRTAETILFRQEGDEIVYLNQPNRLAAARMPTRYRIEAGGEVLEIKALLGHWGTVVGRDQQGVAVLAEIRPVPGSTWNLATRIDRSEIFAQLRSHAWLTMVLTVGLVTASGFAAGFLVKRQEAKQSERELAIERHRRELAERLEHLLKHANDAILLADQHQRILEANDRAVTLYGYGLPELQAMRLWQLRSPASMTAPGQENAGPSVPQAVYETEHQRKNGSCFPVEVSTNGVDIAGTRYQLAILRDITQRRSHEREIARLNRLYATLSQINQMIVRVRSREELFQEVCWIMVEYGGFKVAWIGWHDQGTGAVQCLASAGHCQDHGDFSRVAATQSLQGQDPVAISILESRVCVSNDLSRDSRSPDWRQSAMRHQLHSLAALPVRCRSRVCGALAVYADEAGVFQEKEIALLSETAIDISFALDHLEDVQERKVAERAVRDREEKFRLFINHAPAALAMFSHEMCYLAVSRRWLLDFRLEGQDIIGRSHYDVFPEMPDRMKDAHRRGLRGEIVRADEDCLLRADGTAQWLCWEVQPWHISDGRIGGIIIHSEDITERKRLALQLRQAQKLEAVGQLAGGVAHDFNNILAAMMMTVGLLQQRPNLEKEVREELDALASQTDRAATLTRQLLLFSRRSVMQVQQIDFNAAIENLLKMLRRIIGEQIELDWRPCPNPPRVAADPGMLDQLVMNLVVNARDAMPNGGQIKLLTEAVVLDPAQASLHSEARPGQFVCLSIADTGCGMDESILKRVFEPFFTTKEVGKGTGLGLATVYGIAKQHQGWVTVESSVGSGSIFRVFFPAVDGQSAPAVAHESRAIQTGHEAVLLVEDDPAVRQATADLLTQCGYAVIEAADSREAYVAWNGRKDQIDLLLTDMVMPGGVTGLQLAHRLQAEKPALKVIISSGYSPDLTDETNPGQAIVFLPKPCSPEVLTATIRRCVSGA